MPTDKIFYKLEPVEQIINDEVTYLGYAIHLYANEPTIISNLGGS